jgi:hypothetical protein
MIDKTREREQKTSQSLNPILNLKQAFAQRDSFFSNRSSCVFPIYFKTVDNDLHIVFLNYWTLKNKIPTNKLALNFRVYDNTGSLIKRHTELNFHNHNQFSIKNIIGDKLQTDFNGMVDVEIISTDNLRFSFPGIVGIYQSGDFFSAVHSAGRIKNTDEAHLTTFTHETNWSCKFSEDTTPFFHLFIGNKKPSSSIITVLLKSKTGEIVQEKIIDISHMDSFSSNLFFADEVFKKENLQQDNFISVLVEHGSTFPRMVVGNYFKSIHHLEVTHSFPLIEKNDYCRAQEINQIPSILNCYTDKNLSLTTKVFPTNCAGTFKAVLNSQEFDETSLKSQKIEKEYSTGPKSFSIQETLGKNEKFRAFHFYGDEIPSRFNASFIYKVRNINSNFSTDIASGAKSCVYPPKYRHWGHAYVENGYDTSILIRNNSHKPSETKDSEGTLTIYSQEEIFTIKFEINAESSLSIPLLKNINPVYKTSNKYPNFLSWIVELDVPTCETFWISYRKTDGAIFGEHGF